MAIVSHNRQHCEEVLTMPLAILWLIALLLCMAVMILGKVAGEHTASVAAGIMTALLNVALLVTALS